MTTIAERAKIRERLAREDEADRLNAEQARLDVRKRQAQLADADRFIEAGKQQERDEWWAERAAGREDMARRRAELDAMTPLVAASTPDERRRQFAEVSAFSEKMAAEELDAAWRQVQADEDRKVVEFGFREAYARLHPGGLDACTCLGHRLMRREV